MSLQNYWPTADQIAACIRTEAETTDESVLLAVHQPTRIVLRSASGATVEERTEQDLLNALLRDNTDGSAVVISLTGPSGVGKSHMVRWLHAQLARHERRDDLVVILIPKTASLRGVVELILEPLVGPEYDQLRTDLKKAIGSISKEDAPARLATELSLQLKRRYTEWAQALRAGGPADLKDRAYHAKQMELLLSDPIFREKMLNKALERIVNRAIVGSIPGSEQLPQFEFDDFDWPNAEPFSDATKPAQQYYQRLCDHDGQQRHTAISVLNSVIDPALRTVFQFAQALGGRTIEEIVGAIRVQLHQEKKELVLLIEDFAALSGIQEPLLSLIIAESDHGGKRVRAPIRTALAVTDGFMPQRDTILTRAKGEWVIASEYSDEDSLLGNFVEIAGRYLNAARWGAERLRQQFEARSDQSNAGLYGWVRAYENENLSAEEVDVLKAFGQTQAGYYLFPFTVQALHSFCRKELTSGGQLRFNPRAFINQVLRDTLQQRDWYQKGAFPQPGFKAGFLPSGAETDLDGLPYPLVVKQRLKVLLIHWCGSPTNLRMTAPVGNAVFEAFALPFPFSGKFGANAHPSNAVTSGKVAATSTSAATTAIPVTSPVTPVTSTAPPPSAPTPFEIEIEQWGGGNILQQVVAREIRNVLAEAVSQRIDWNSLNIKKTEIKSTWFWLPYVRTGNPQIPPKIIVAEETGEVAGWLRKAIIGLSHWSEAKQSWNYLGAEDDYGFAQKLIDEVVPQVEAYLSDLAEKRLAASLRVAHRQSLLLGLRALDSMPAVLEKIFAKPPTAFRESDFLVFGEADKAAAAGRALIRAAQSRKALQDYILQQMGCFQGIRGDNAYAIDYRRAAAAWVASVDENILRGVTLPQPVMDHITEITKGLNVVISHFQVVVATHGQRLMTALGDNFTKDAWITAIKKTLAAAHMHGYAPTGFDQQKVFEQLDGLGRMALTELLISLREATSMSTEADSVEQLRILCRVDIATLLRAVNEVARIQAYFDAIDKRMQADELASKEDSFTQGRIQFIQDLQLADELLEMP